MFWRVNYWGRSVRHSCRQCYEYYNSKILTQSKGQGRNSFVVETVLQDLCIFICIFICIFLFLIPVTITIKNLFFCGAATQRGSWPPYSWGFLDHRQRRTTVGTTPLDEWSARRRDLYLTTTQHSQQTKIHAPRWDSNPQSQQASGRRPTP